MYSLQEWINNKYYELTINEGGMGGHMAHPIDYDELTCADLKDMISQLFSGKIENMKEKLDGTNIQATVNKNDEVVFIRNKGDLNSEKGGMSVEDMTRKWADKPSVAKNYIKAGEVIKKIFLNVPNDYFNPDDETRVIINCECISAGQTNVMLYKKDRVAFHGTATYKLVNSKWQLEAETEGEPKEIRKAAEGIKEAAPRPQLVIRDIHSANAYTEKAIKKIDDLFKEYNISNDGTIAEYKKTRYMELAPDWAKNDDCYERIVNDNKTKNLRELKKQYPELPAFEKSKEKKKLLKDIMSELDYVFSSIGNSLIELLDGFTNGGSENKVKSELLKQLQDVKDATEKDGTEEMREVMRQSIARLERLSSKINATEGIVFQYKGKLMKLTGAFAALNQALGVKFMK